MIRDERSVAAHRLDAFVDAAFAFSVTLLVISGGMPSSIGELVAAMGRIPAFAASFALVVLFWMSHRSFGRIVPERDALSSALSLAIVFVVLIYVFPLRVLVEAAGYWLSGGRLPGGDLIHSWGDLRALYVVYGLGYALLSGLYAALFRHAALNGERLGATVEGRTYAADSALIWSVCAFAGVLSVLLAFLAPLRIVPWLPPSSYWLIPLFIALRPALLKRKAAAAPTPAAEAPPAQP